MAGGPCLRDAGFCLSEIFVDTLLIRLLDKGVAIGYCPEYGHPRLPNFAS